MRNDRVCTLITQDMCVLKYYLLQKPNDTNPCSPDDPDSSFALLITTLLLIVVASGLVVVDRNSVVLSLKCVVDGSVMIGLKVTSLLSICSLGWSAGTQMSTMPVALTARARNNPIIL